MKISRLKNLFNKNRNQENWCKYKIQCNYFVNLLYKTKKKKNNNNNITRI